MTETASLVIKVDSSGADRATRSLDKLDRAAGGSERAAHKLGKAWGAAIGLISTAAIAGATTAFIRQADAYANMAAKVRLVTGSQQAQLKAQKALFDLSQRTSGDLETTTDLYVKLGQSSDALAKNQELLLSVTEKVSKALVISGADAASSSAVIRQFSQAMAAGTLRGDEFVSVMEGAPRLARAIADGLQVPIGALREMAGQGELTAAKVIKALEDQGATIDREFGSMPLTVSRATQQVKNALLEMIGATDQAEGASNDLAEAIANLAEQISDPEFQQGFATVVGGLVDTATWAAKAASEVGNLVGKYNDWLASKGFVPTDGDSTREELEARRDRLATAADRASGGVGAAVFGEGTEAKLRAELAAVEQQLATYGVNFIRPGDSTPESILKPAKGGAGASETATGSGGGKGLTEAQKAAQRLQAAYESLSESQREQIALFGETTEAAKVRYATEQGALSGLSDAKKAQLVADAEYIDLQEVYGIIVEEAATATTNLANARIESANAVSEGIAATDRLISDMEFELSLIGLSNIEREKAIALRWADAAATDEQIAKIQELAGATEKAREQQQFADETQRSLTNAVVDYASGAKSATEAFGDFADQLFERALQFVADKAIQAMFDSFNGKGGASGGSSGGGFDWGGLFGSILGAFGGGSANGNVFSGGSQVTAFANGGIVGGPTLFPMSGNRTGLMGEAGPEAIVPLKRGRDGKLGVSSGSSNTTNISINVPNVVQYRTAQQIAQEAGAAQQRAQVRNR